jgi:hypothetical protein
VQLLLSFGADPNKTDRYGRNVVKQAAMMRRKDIVRVLEKYYPTPKVRPVQIGRASLPASYKPDANLSPRRTNRTRISPAPARPPGARPAGGRRIPRGRGGGPEGRERRFAFQTG